MEERGLWDQEPVLSRGERLRREREAAHQRPVRTRLRITAAAALVVALLVWLLVSWLIRSPSSSSSEALPEPPALVAEGDEPRPREEPPAADGTPEHSPEQGPEQGSGHGTAADADEPSPDGADAPAEDDVPLVLHVAGAVREPGVVELPPGSRIHDALEQAGGAEDDAALDVVNLAAPAVDGTLVHVPTREEADAAEPATPWIQDGPGVDGGPGSDQGQAQEEGAPGPRVDLNTAEAGELEQLPGIGPALAERILDHRSRHGPFGSLEELAAVRGIGPTILEDVADQVTW